MVAITNGAEDKIKQIIEAYGEASGLSAFINTASRILGYPLHLLDFSYKVIAVSNTADVDDMVWLETARLGYMSDRIVGEAAKRHQPLQAKNKNEQVTFFWFGSQAKYPMYVKYIYDYPNNRGYNAVAYLAMLCTKGEPTQENKAIMDVLGYLLGKYLSLSRPGSICQDSLCEEILVDFIQNHTTDALSIEKRIYATDLDSRKHMILINMCYVENYGYIRSLLKEYFSGCHVIYMEQQLCMLLCRENNIAFLSDRETLLLDNLLTQNGAYACISDSFRSFTRLSFAYEENKRLLNVIMQKRSQGASCSIMEFHGNLFYFDQLKAVALILMAKQKNNDFSARYYVSNSVLQLDDYDRENRTNYFETLMTFLNVGQSYEQTSKKLFVHKNTVVYRMHRIKQDFGLDWSGDNALASLMFSCNLLYWSKRLS